MIADHSSSLAHELFTLKEKQRGLGTLSNRNLYQPLTPPPPQEEEGERVSQEEGATGEEVKHVANNNDPGEAAAGEAAVGEAAVGEAAAGEATQPSPPSRRAGSFISKSKAYTLISELAELIHSTGITVWDETTSAVITAHINKYFRSV